MVLEKNCFEKLKTFFTNYFQALSNKLKNIQFHGNLIPQMLF